MKQKQLEHFTTFQKDPVIINGFVTGFVSWLVSTVVLIWSYKDLPVVVPLFYSLSRGHSQLADKPFIFVLTILSIVFFVTHLILLGFNMHKIWFFPG